MLLQCIAFRDNAVETFIAARIEMVKLYLSVGHLEDAMKYAQEAEQKMLGPLRLEMPENEYHWKGWVQTLVADVFEAMGKEEEASQHQKRAYELHSLAPRGVPYLDDRIYRRRLAKRLLREGKLVEA